MTASGPQPVTLEGSTEVADAQTEQNWAQRFFRYNAGPRCRAGGHGERGLSVEDITAWFRPFRDTMTTGDVPAMTDWMLPSTPDDGGSGNFADNPEKASEAGRKGGRHSHGGK